MTKFISILAFGIPFGFMNVSAQSKVSIVELTSSNAPKQFICNEKLCKGKQTGYYSNGIIEIEGYFKRGRAKGKVINYDSTGMLQTKRIFKKGYIKRSLSFDTLLRLTRDINFRKRRTSTYYFNNTGNPFRKEILIWQDMDWSKGRKVTYERKNNRWIEISKSN